MKQLVLLFTGIIFMFFAPESTSDFDYELRKIAREFRESIMEDPCEAKREVDYLIDDIEEELEDEYDAGELRILKESLKKAEALEEYIAAIGECNLRPISLEDFFLANNLVGGQLVEIKSDEYCFDIVSLTIADYVVYMAWNETSQNYSVEIALTLKKLRPGESMNNKSFFGLPSNHLRPFYTNKEETSWKEIKIVNVSCRTW